MKDFRLYIPDKTNKLNINNSDIEPNPLELKLPTPGTIIVREYKPTPTTQQWRAVNNYQSHYTQHRQQDWGRAIALNLDPSNQLLSNDDNLWTFQNYTEKRNGDLLKISIFEWDGIGPPGSIQFENSYSTVSGWPHKYTWAAWFIVNGIPSNEIWPPIPSRNPNWNFEPYWPEYPFV